ncbi:transglutaminase-like domain-containing protein [Streptomyces albidus (ex Kaewkla and Franco 2022)]|uniref:transglutaminase-like domain-containing protein n=1 Tax=Streptomyces albidus (ex Kaewkla and Franco 2022) TaxID=722709 RepID=UPI001F2EB6A9|nr:transglutaminase-like domain-containing protein [Streptomyces albidus (ex Kaewkla and Franco 2022)]
MTGEEESTGGRGNRRRFAEEAREERPDLALLCLLIGAEAASVPSGGAERAAKERGREEACPNDDGPEEVGGEADDREEDTAPVPDEGGTDEAGVLESEIELDRLAGLLPYATARGPQDWARALAQLLGTELGFRGAPPDYQRLESSLLQSVLRRRRGLPILLSVVWMEVARRAGAPVYGVALPGHFVVGFGDPSGEHVLADPYDGGRTLSGSDVERLVADATGSRGQLSETVFQPAGPREIVLRILNNIRAWASARPEHSAVQLWALEMSLLLPHHPAQLRYEHARLLVERGDFLEGAAEMEDYAEVVEAAQPSAAEAVRKAAHAARARLN